MLSIASSIWKGWQRDYFPTLMVRQKWHVEKRNIRPGDIVIVKDSNTIRGKWKLAQVTKAEKGRDGRGINYINLALIIKERKTRL